MGVFVSFNRKPLTKGFPDIYPYERGHGYELFFSLSVFQRVLGIDSVVINACQLLNHNLSGRFARHF